MVRPELTEGPYYVDEELDRSDIRSDPSDGTVQAGALLALNFAVSRIASGACTPLQGAIVNVWHCNTLGVYSGVCGPPPLGPAGRPRPEFRGGTNDVR